MAVPRWRQEDADCVSVTQVPALPDEATDRWPAVDFVLRGEGLLTG